MRRARNTKGHRAWRETRAVHLPLSGPHPVIQPLLDPNHPTERLRVGGRAHCPALDAVDLDSHGTAAYVNTHHPEIWVWQAEPPSRCVRRGVRPGRSLPTPSGLPR